MEESLRHGILSFSPRRRGEGRVVAFARLGIPNLQPVIRSVSGFGLNTVIHASATSWSATNRPNAQT